MGNQCEYVEYKATANGKEFDTERPYCTIADQFVQPMRGDICAKRYSLSPDVDCEIYRSHTTNK